MEYKIKDLIQSNHTKRYAIVTKLENNKKWGIWCNTKEGAVKSYIVYLKGISNMYFEQFSTDVSVIESPVNLNILVEG